MNDRIFRVAERTESDDGHIKIQLSEGDINLNGNNPSKTSGCKLRILGALNIRRVYTKRISLIDGLMCTWVLY